MKHLKRKITTLSLSLFVMFVCCLGIVVNDESHEGNKTKTYVISSVVKQTSNGNEETQIIKKTFDSKEAAEAYLSALEKEGYTIVDKTITQNSHEEIITLERTFETMEEAESLLTAFKETYNNASGVINHYTTTEETGETIEELVNSTTNTVEKLYIYDNESDANAKKEELENSGDGKYIQISVTINHNIVDTGEDETLTETKTFESESEAEAFLAELEADGYTITNKNITQNSHEETVTLEKTFETKTEAEAALADFENTYSNVTSDGVKENKTENVIEPVNGDTPYSTKEAAEAALEAFLNDPNNETDEYYFTGEVSGPTGTGEYETTEINETFASEAEALAFLENFENEDYTIISYQFTKDTQNEQGSINQKFDTMTEAEAALAAFRSEYPNEVQYNIETIAAGTVYESTTITEDMKIYQIGNTTFIIIKHGHDVYVWTENPLTEEEITQFKNTYREIATDPVLTGDAVASNSTIFVSGYNDIIEHNGKRFRFIKNENNEIIIDMDSGGESRVVSGTFTPVTQYLLTASGSKTVELESGTLTGKKKKEILGYYINLVKKAKNYSVSASGIATILDNSYTLEVSATRDIMKDEYALDVTTTENTYITYPETFEKDWYDVVASAPISILEEKYTLEATIRKNKYSVEVMPPKTGVETSNTNYLILILMVLISMSKITVKKVKTIFVK